MLQQREQSVTLPARDYGRGASSRHYAPKSRGFHGEVTIERPSKRAMKAAATAKESEFFTDEAAEAIERNGIPIEAAWPPDWVIHTIPGLIGGACGTILFLWRDPAAGAAVEAHTGKDALEFLWGAPGSRSRPTDHYS